MSVEEFCALKERKPGFLPTPEERARAVMEKTRGYAPDFEEWVEAIGKAVNDALELAAVMAERTHAPFTATAIRILKEPLSQDAPQEWQSDLPTPR
jgi:hypothetical protein